MSFDSVNPAKATAPRRILVAVAGSEPKAFWDALPGLLPEGDVELLHVVDDAPRHEMDLARIRHPGLARPPRPREREVDAERRGADAILGDAAARLGREARLHATDGRPELEIEAEAGRWAASLIVVCARTHSDGPATGPGSVGHVARHVADHAPCPVLIVRSVLRAGGGH